jgi:hypothetical protein
MNGEGIWVSVPIGNASHGFFHLGTVAPVSPPVSPRYPRSMERLARFAALALVTAACGGNVGGDTTETLQSGTTSTGPTTTSVPAEIRPPDLIVIAGSDEVALIPYSYCWHQDTDYVCADGEPADSPALTLEDGDQLSLVFPVDWHLQGSLVPEDGPCDGTLEVDVLSDGTPITAIGPAGSYRFDVFGQGEGGEGAWSFGLTVVGDRPEPPMFLQTSWYPGGGDLDPDATFSAGLGNLSQIPAEISAQAVVTASNGASQVFDLAASTNDDCWTSTVSLGAPADFSGAVIDLGPQPFEVSVTVDVDGVSLMAETLTWPNDYPAYSSESRSPVGTTG